MTKTIEEIHKALEDDVSLTTEEVIIYAQHKIKKLECISTVSVVDTSVKFLQKHYVSVDYTNWRLERKQYVLCPVDIWFGSTQWHPIPQWLLKAVDVRTANTRDFALRCIHSWTPYTGPVGAEKSTTGT